MVLPPIVAVVGPTASGKSAIALEAARRVAGTEVVSVDAFAVYRSMDIGTAKPDVAARRVVPHHLIDVVEPTEDFDVARFRAAYAVVRADLDRRCAPSVLVGGTGLYHRVVVDGLEPPGRWPDVRARLERELVEVGPEVLHARLADADPRAASRMEPTNSRRVVRALEVVEGSGRPFSSFGPGLDAYPPTRTVQIGVRRSREDLARRVRDRVLAMVEAGWLDEVRDLLRAGGWSATAGQAIGYPELAEVVSGSCSFDVAIETIVARTRRLAVRQERWFRRDPRVRWVDVDDDPSTTVAAVAAVVRGLHDHRTA